MATLIQHENGSAKTYASRKNAETAITKSFSKGHMRYLIVRTDDDRYQPIIIQAGDYSLLAYAHNGFFVCGV